MVRVLFLMALLLGVASTARADVWQWVDAQGVTHYVDSDRPIYSWVDEQGKVHYSDKPDHDNAVSVEFIWYSKGTLDDTQAAADVDASAPSSYAAPGETDAERADRQKTAAHNCKRATEIYDSYVASDRLYQTDANGKREFLSKSDAAAMLAETKARVEEWCS